MAAAPTDPKNELIDRAKALAPMLAEHAAPSEALRHPTDEVMTAIEEAEIFKLMVPTRYGGFGLDMDAFVEVVLALGEGDASLAWVTSFLIEHNWMFCCFPESFQKQLYADRSYVLAPGMIAPTGKATPATGGAVLSGRWPFATGIWQSSWVIAGGIVGEVEGMPDMRFFAIPREEVTVEDTWHMDGMAGTGSHDVLIEEVFVPEERSVSILAMNQGKTPGADIHDHPLYRTPMMPLLCTAASMPSVGQTRAVLRTYTERLPTRRRMGFQDAQSEMPQNQIRLGRLSVAADQAELLLRDTVDQLCALRDGADPGDRTRMQARFASVVHQCKDIIGEVCAVSGANAHQLKDPLQRARRDVEVMSCHVAFDLDLTLESLGRALLGGAPSPMV